MPRVWSKHQRYPRGAVYVGRPTRWGNPFVIGVDGNREQVVRRFEQMLRSRPRMMRECREELRGKDLVCWCAPHRCHADILLAVANDLEHPVQASLL